MAFRTRGLGDVRTRPKTKPPRAPAIKRGTRARYTVALPCILEVTVTADTPRHARALAGVKALAALAGPYATPVGWLLLGKRGRRTFVPDGPHAPQIVSAEPIEDDPPP
jgi:hypothetical protein